MRPKEENKRLKISKGAKKMLNEIMLNPNISSKELAINLKISSANCGNQITKLLERNLVYVTKEGKKRLWNVTDFYLKNRHLIESDSSIEDISVEANTSFGIKNSNMNLWILTLIKNILISSDMLSSKIIYENLELILEYFSPNELLLLLYILEILKVEKENEEMLFGFINPSMKNNIETDLMFRYKDILYYIAIRNEGRVL